ncbi:hypothetical protein IG631_19169 [Alternaria alternata]|nr:hypothetical protein IG631_19169 [Alternaria alternata]
MAIKSPIVGRLGVIELEVRSREVPRGLDGGETFCGARGVSLLRFGVTALLILRR